MIESFVVQAANMVQPMQPKISSALAERLAVLAPSDVLRVIVLLNLPAPAKTKGRRLTVVERSAALERTRDAAARAMDALAPILRRHGTRLLENSPLLDLGTLAVEASPAGVVALGESDLVRAVVEDQPMVQIR